MRDIQKEKPEFEFPLNKVGVKDVAYPLVVLDKENKKQNTVANINMYVNLPHIYRGTHMSRFIEILKRYRGKITYKQIKLLLQEMKGSFDAECAHIELAFPYFIEKKAPVSGQKSLLKYDVKFEASYGESYHFILCVQIPVQTLCPCSKEISSYGAHNQRSVISISIESKGLFW
ncbi:MAG TPA: GTP cyclohydrolase I FolE2, partial [Firmicutes bacterium]|nr:GTP cyclohydrolase I FolE2 [Bacillota bacterium]